jgi:hypothetical protein
LGIGIDGNPARFNEGEFKIQINYKKWSWKEKFVGKFTLGPVAQATLVCKTIKYTGLHCLPRAF